jgi:MtN3 and saliva related transmembrane protein
MTSASVDALGYAGGAISALVFVPQIVRAARTRSTGDLSILTLAMMLVGCSLLIAYGVLSGQKPVYATISVNTALTTALLVLKIVFDSRATAGAVDVDVDVV